MELENNEKVLAMYRAVWSLIDEGCDINRLKVADITARAGIGKGTAYEYFRSKEEILERAIAYDTKQQCSQLISSVEKQDTLKGCMESVFEWIEKNIDRERFVVPFMRIAREIPVKSDADLTCVERHVGKSMETSEYILELMVHTAKKEGTISQEADNKLAAYEILGKIIVYFLYLKFEKTLEIGEIRQTKKFLYDNIVKSLKKGNAYEV